MAKLNSDLLNESVDKLLKFSKGEKITVGGVEKEGKVRKFTETIELQVGLKNFDPKKDKRFSGTYTLPTLPRPNMKVCILANAKHAEAAQAIGLDFRTVDDLKSLNKNKKLIKKMAKKYDALSRLTRSSSSSPVFSGRA